MPPHQFGDGDRKVAVKFGLLLQIGHPPPLARGADDLAPVGPGQPDQHIEQGAFTRAIRPDDRGQAARGKTAADPSSAT
jgi:hypothetical protein